MKDSTFIIKHLDLQINDLKNLLSRSKGKYDQRKLDSLEAEIQGLESRKSKHMMEVN